MNIKTKRILSGVGALLVAAALAVGGTFAYTAFEHKSNPMRNEPNYQGRLVEDFDPDPDWVVDQDIKKEVSIKNMGGTAQFPGSNWGDIFVRVKLKEHMDLTPINYIYYPESDTAFNTRFMVDKNGDFVRFAAGASTAPNMTEILASTVWAGVISDTAKLAAFKAALTAGDFIKLQGYYDTQEYWYLVTKEGDPNGQYGAFVVMDKVADASGRVSVTGSTRAAGVDYSKGAVNSDPSVHENDECLYPVHYWDNADPALCALDTHNYVQWNLSSSIVLAADWDGNPVNKWILDPVTGWATWGNALKAGESTDLLLESIRPILYPDGEMLYVIHADMQATDLTEMINGDWGGDDWIIKDPFDPKNTNIPVTGVSILGGNRSMAVGDTLTLVASVQPPNASNKKVTWSSSNPAIADVDSTGKVTAKAAGGPVTITVTTEDGGKTATCEITVVPASIPATGVTISAASPMTIEAGQKVTLPITVAPADATDLPVWSSSNTGRVAVNQSGEIEGISVGDNTAITVRLNASVSASIVVNVVAKTVPATGVTINGPRTVTLDIGETYTPTVTVTPADATDAKSWSAADSGIASVSPGGVIKGESAGTTTITVTLRPGVSDTITVIVNPGADPDIPTKNGEGPYQMQGNDLDALNYAVQVVIDKNDFAGAQLKKAGSLKLSDILASGFDYSGMTVTAEPGSLNPAVSIGKDKDAADAILITYFGTEAQWAATQTMPGNPFPEVQMTLVLHKTGYADTAIKVNLAFNGSIYG